MRIAEGIQKLTDYYRVRKSTFTIAGQGEKTLEEREEDFTLLKPCIFILSIGVGSLTGFAHLQDLLQSIQVLTEMTGPEDLTIAKRHLLLFPEQIRRTTQSQWRPTRTNDNDLSSNSIVRGSIQALPENYNSNKNKYYLHSNNEPEFYILAIDPEFQRERGRNGGAGPIQKLASQLGLHPQVANDPTFQVGEFDSKGICCAFVDEALPSKYSASVFGELPEETRNALRAKTSEFYERARTNKSFAFTEECIPDEAYPLNALQPFLEEILTVNKGFCIVDNKAWWHVNNNYHENYFFETMCEIPYLFTHPPYDAFQSQLYWLNPVENPTSFFKKKLRNPELVQMDQLFHFGNTFHTSKGGSRRTLRKRRKSRTRKNR